MKKMLMCTLLGIAVGFGIGKMSNDVEKTEVKVESHRKLESVHTFMEKFVEEDGNCFMCGEELYESEKMVCIYCRQFLDGFSKGVEKMKEKYHIVDDENL